MIKVFIMDLGYLITYDSRNMHYESVYAELDLDSFYKDYDEAIDMNDNFYVENHFNTTYFYRNKRFECINDIINISDSFKNRLYDISDINLYYNTFNTDLDFNNDISIRFDLEQYQSDLKNFDMYEKHSELFIYYGCYDLLKKFDIIAPKNIERAYNCVIGV